MEKRKDSKLLSGGMKQHASHATRHSTVTPLKLSTIRRILDLIPHYH